MKRKDIYWYLESVGGMEVFEFENHDQAYAFGHKIRENEGDKIDVEIGEKNVRIRLVEQAVTVPTKRKSKV
jgi:hypothetical protein